jgi:hypothetical protein
VNDQHFEQSLVVCEGSPWTSFNTSCREWTVIRQLHMRYKKHGTLLTRTAQEGGRGHPCGGASHSRLAAVKRGRCPLSPVKRWQLCEGAWVAAAYRHPADLGRAAENGLGFLERGIVLFLLTGTLDCSFKGLLPPPVSTSNRRDRSCGCGQVGSARTTEKT